MTKFFGYLVQLVVHSGNAPPLFFLFEQEDDFSFCRSNADWYEAPIKANFLFTHFSLIIFHISFVDTADSITANQQNMCFTSSKAEIRSCAKIYIGFVSSGYRVSMPFDFDGLASV